MPSELPKPTRRTTLTQLCQELVPAWSHALSSPAHVPQTPAFVVQLTVEGDTQHLELHTQGAAHKMGPAENPHVALSCDKDAWRTAMETLVPLGISHLETRLESAKRTLTALQPQAKGMLETFFANPGAIVLTFTDDAGDTAEYTFRLGTGSGPTTRVGLDDKRLHNLINGHAKIPQVLASVDIQGDAAYVTRLLQAFLP